MCEKQPRAGESGRQGNLGKQRLFGVRRLGHCRQILEYVNVLLETCNFSRGLARIASASWRAVTSTSGSRAWTVYATGINRDQR